MTPPIERIRYYDGEYLRAFDFNAEQGYHVDMRRRLNMALHLYGIVEGLQLTQTKNAGITQVSVGTGMAIDPYGREIYLLDPYTFDDTYDVQANHITGSGGSYQVWIQYSRVAATPPSLGYAACNATNQMTRWTESYKIVLLPSSTPPPSQSPAVTDDISEGNPDSDTSYGVFLGYVGVAPGSSSGAFTYPPAKLPSQPVPVYIGLLAQRIVCPATPANFQILNPQTAYNPSASLDVQPNVFLDQNLIVGDDFLVDQTTIQPTPAPVAPAVFPALTGNVKIAEDLFLQGELYTYRQVNNPSGPPATIPAWLSLGAYLASLVPDVQTGDSGTVVVAPTGPATALTGIFNATVNTSLPQFTKFKVSAAIASVTFAQNTGLTAADYQNANFGITSTTGTQLSPTQLKLSITWQAGPIEPTATGQPNYFSPISSMVFSYIIIFFP